MNRDELHRCELRYERIAALKRMASTPDGKLALELISEYALEGRQAYRPGQPEADAVFRCGCQQVMIDIRELLQTDLGEMRKCFDELAKANNNQTEEEDL